MNSFSNQEIIKCLLLCLIMTFSMPVLSSVNFDIISIGGSDIEFADFNNDGIVDKYEIYKKISEVSLSENGQEFSNVYSIDEGWANLYDPFLPPVDITSLDVNNDDYIDVVIAFGSRIVIRLNDGNGGFVNIQQYINLSDLYGIDESLVSDAKINFAAKVVAIDINQDGYHDLVVCQADGLSIFLNDTSGHLNHLKNLSITDPTGKDYYVSQFDIDGDLLPEIVITSRGSYVVYFLDDLNVKLISIENQSDSLVLVDIDGDGDYDFQETDNIVNMTPPDFIIYWINEGGGIFTKITHPYSESGVNINGAGSGSIGIQSILVVFILFFLKRLISRITRRYD